MHLNCASCLRVRLLGWMLFSQCRTHMSTTLSIVQGTWAECCGGAGLSCRHALQWISHLTVLWPVVTCPAVAALLAMHVGLCPLNCTANPVVTNGVLSCSTTAAGSNCLGSCNIGYTGSPSVTCNSNGTYSPVTGSCTGASFHRPARHTLHRQQREQRLHGDMCQRHCCESFTLC
jgi:hypothetical protein